MIERIRFAGVLLGFTLLAGCGGSGSAPATPAAPAAPAAAGTMSVTVHFPLDVLHARHVSATGRGKQYLNPDTTYFLRVTANGVTGPFVAVAPSPTNTQVLSVPVIAQVSYASPIYLYITEYGSDQTTVVAQSNTSNYIYYQAGTDSPSNVLELQMNATMIGIAEIPDTPMTPIATQPNSLPGTPTTVNLGCGPSPGSYPFYAYPSDPSGAYVASFSGGIPLVALFSQVPTGGTSTVVQNPSGALTLNWDGSHVVLTGYTVYNYVLNQFEYGYASIAC